MHIEELRRNLSRGLVIPAHPLALTSARKLDERRQRGLSRYYLDAGAGGLAVGVHTTQFAIHQPKVGLYQPVIALAMEEAQRFRAKGGCAPIMVAGLVGDTANAVREAALAREIGYDCGLLSLGALAEADDDTLIEHAQAVAQQIPLFGFYLQPAVGGRVLNYSFWKRFAQIEQVVAIKIAPFNRYFTIDVVRAVSESGRLDEIALYTGNDDNIIGDLVTPFQFGVGGPTARIAGGLLGQWAVWTRQATVILDEAAACRESDPIPEHLIRLNVQLTDANAALFDVAHGFAGCIAGIHEVLRRQGLLEGIWCLDENECLSPGQGEELDRVCQSYPHLTDDDFVSENLDRWMRG